MESSVSMAFLVHSLFMKKASKRFVLIFLKNILDDLMPSIELVMSDWFNFDSSELFAANPFYWAGTNKMFGTTYYHCNDDNKAMDHGVKVSSICMDSLLVNGIGHHRFLKNSNSSNGK